MTKTDASLKLITLIKSNDLDHIKLFPIPTDTFSMKSYFNSTILRFGLWGFLFSLGAPLGFYVHDYFFNPTAKALLWENISWIHQNNSHTIIYIGLGANLFFSLFGMIIGKYSLKLNEANLINQHLKQTKQDLIKHFISQMRISSTIGLESLFHLKDGEFTSRERDNLLHRSIQELLTVDESIRNLIELQNQRIDESQLINTTEIVALIKNSTDKNEINFSINNLLNSEEDTQLVLSALLFQMAMDQLFDWTRNNEIEFVKIQLGYYTKEDGYVFYAQNINHQKSICLQFQLSGCEQARFQSPFFIDIIETYNGTFLNHNDSILIILPIKDVVKKILKVA